MAIGPAAGFEGLLPARPPRLSLLTVPGVLVSDQEKRAGAPEGDSLDRALARWEAGVRIAPEKCLSAAMLDLETATDDYPFWWECPEGSGQTPEDANVAGSGTKEVGAAEGVLTFTPYMVWAGHSCRAQDWDRRRDEVERRARASLECITPRAVEHELWTGQVRNAAGFSTPYLADPDHDTQLAAAGLGFVTALGELEDAISECSCAEDHMIHAERRTVTAWISRGLMDLAPDGTHLRTKLGTVVVPGAGYPGTGPSQSQSGEGVFGSSYAYASSRVRVFLSEPSYRGIPQETVDRSVNDWVVRAERVAVAVFDRCCVVGLPVLLCDEYCGSGS